MKIICIGRNYVNHAKEMKAEIPSEPIFFFKPNCAIIRSKKLYIPEFTNDLHHEVELIVKINRVGKHIAKEFAHKYYNEIGLGIDFTARDVQSECKKKGMPWEKAKAFDNSALISKTFIQKTDLDLNNINFSLDKNNKEVQKGNSKEMLFDIDDIISYLSKFVTLKIGDLIFTGTPEGVGAVAQNDTLIGKLNDQEMFHLSIK